VNIQLEVTGSAVFAKIIRAVCGSLVREAMMQTMSRLSNLGKQFAVDAIDDFVNVKVSVCDTAS